MVLVKFKHEHNENSFARNIDALAKQVRKKTSA